MSFAKIVFTPCSYVGWGALEQLVPEVTKYDLQKILVITDPMLEKLGIVHKITNPLKEAGYTVTIYSNVVPEPPLEIGEKLVSYTRQEQFEMVIGVGGGSALDLAKLAAVLATNEGKVADYLNLTGEKTLVNKGLPKILIPTTSGTGSEVTNIAVLSLETTKDVVTHDFLLADVAIVDPQLTVSVPPRITAATGVDALTHAIEAYLSLNASPTTDGLALQAIQLISRSLRTTVQDGNNQQARIDMSIGSYIAGLAFFNAGVAGVHALAYPLGGQYHLSHGESNAVLLPYVMGYIRHSCSRRLVDIYKCLSGNIDYLSEEEASYKCVEALAQLVEDVGIPSTLAEFQIPETAVESLTQAGVQQKRLLARSPYPLLEEDIRNIYHSAFSGVISEPKMI
ncbi:iron-containing alcohol dehydrogenase [Bacillus massiliigorillae]|uniref:iron-containing alcohol dehydrogenase n=1 Tax=Bacillus massiliigorillae TaxID=1243664 RepID=UPI00039E4853|nr:iron-containing alcohol dehydrogenase [Bacillus massiliigorillae]